MSEVAARIVTRELLEAMRRTHPLEAAMATLLIKEGAWKVAEDSDAKSETMREPTKKPAHQGHTRNGECHHIEGALTI